MCLSNARAALYPAAAPIPAPAETHHEPFLLSCARVPSRDRMTDPEAGMLLRHSQYTHHL